MENYYTEPKYEDREAAGRVLAEKLQSFRNERPLFESADRVIRPDFGPWMIPFCGSGV